MRPRRRILTSPWRLVVFSVFVRVLSGFEPLSPGFEPHGNLTFWNRKIFKFWWKMAFEQPFASKLVQSSQASLWGRRALASVSVHASLCPVTIRKFWIALSDNRLLGDFGLLLTDQVFCSFLIGSSLLTANNSYSTLQNTYKRAGFCMEHFIWVPCYINITNAYQFLVEVVQ